MYLFIAYLIWLVRSKDSSFKKVVTKGLTCRHFTVFQLDSISNQGVKIFFDAIVRVHVMVTGDF